MNHSLKPWNTFGIERFAKTIVRAETEQQLLSAWQTAAAAGEPTLVAMLVSLLIGSVLLVPALVYLYRLFQRAGTDAPVSYPGPG